MFDHQAFRRDSSLDESQCGALIQALSRSLALVQGPPGTGKSYTGVALLKILLKSRDRAHLGPIICVCYTNHALDQLLEHLVGDGIGNIVRLGSRSKSAVLEPFNLRQVSMKQDKTKTEKRRTWELHQMLDLDMGYIRELLPTVKRVDSWKNLEAYLETEHPRHHDQLFGIDHDGFQTVHQNLGQVIRKWLHCKTCANDEHPFRPTQILLQAAVHEMSAEERLRLHRYWIKDITDTLCEDLSNKLRSYTNTRELLNQCRQELNLRCLQEAHVIGVTTTGLARNLDVLGRLPSKVVMCEEAGEVLEAHILTALLPQIEHAILIGDHQQLRPQIQMYELQHESPSGEKYSLDVSLFERLVKAQGDRGFQLPVSMLEVQRRMHPSIAQLIRDTLYPTLQDHPSVHEYPEVCGLGKRLYWLDHGEFEAGDDATGMLSTSHSNDFEVEMTAALVSHLVRQGNYRGQDIAVLTPYLGQLQKLQKRLSASHELVVSDRDAEDLKKEDLDDELLSDPSSIQKTTLLEALRIATVDNFQVCGSADLVSRAYPLSYCRAKRPRWSSYHWFVVTQVTNVGFSRRRIASTCF